MNQVKRREFKIGVLHFCSVFYVHDLLRPSEPPGNWLFSYFTDRPTEDSENFLNLFTPAGTITTWEYFISYLAGQTYHIYCVIFNITILWRGPSHNHRYCEAIKPKKSQITWRYGLDMECLPRSSKRVGLQLMALGGGGRPSRGQQSWRNVFTGNVPLKDMPWSYLPSSLLPGCQEVRSVASPFDRDPKRWSQLTMGWNYEIINQNKPFLF